MACHEIVFAGGNCYIEVDEGPWSPAGQSYTARMSVLDRQLGRRRPLVFPDGRRIEVHAATEPLAVQNAASYLEQHFGAQSLPQHECVDVDNPPAGPPLILETRRGDA
jgi:hypothetical protein